MEDKKIIVGLDIGTTKICAIAGRKNKYGKLEVLGLGKAPSQGVVRGVITNIDKTVTAIKRAVQEAEEKANIDIKVVNVGIAGRHIKSVIQHGSITRDDIDEEITVEDVQRLAKDMYKLVALPGSEIIHVIPQDYTVDYDEGVKDPVGMSGVKLEGNFQVITAPSSTLHNLRKCLKRSNLEPASLILEPLASSTAVLSTEEKEAGVCLVDIGGGTVDIAVFYDSVIRHTAVIPFGGDIITDDIKQGCMMLESCMVTEYQAELLKTKFGRAIADEESKNEVITIPGLRNRPPKEISSFTLARIIEARMEEIIELVYAHIIASGLQDKLAAGIVITGGGAQLLHTRQLFEYITGYDTRIGYPNEHLSGGTDIVKSPMYATGVGLVLAGFQSIDYREEHYKKTQPKTTPTPPSPDTKQKSSEGFFRKIIEKTKGLLIDDYDDKKIY